MRAIPLILVAAITSLPAMPAAARHHDRYNYNGHSYSSYQQCVDAKRRAQKRGTIAGAATAGAGAALLGGNLGESLLVAGGGALVGSAIGKNSKHC